MHKDIFEKAVPGYPAPLLVLLLVLTIGLSGCGYHVSSLDGSGDYTEARPGGDAGEEEGAGTDAGEAHPGSDAGESADGSGAYSGGDSAGDAIRDSDDESAGSGSGNSTDEADETVHDSDEESAGSTRESSDNEDAEETNGADSTAGEEMQGPDTPPDGERYDEWKGFEYTEDTTFSTRGYWAIHLSNGGIPSDYGIEQDPDYIDGTLTITDVKAEPVGGEMKLRSGGYVDVTVEAEWTGTITMKADPESAFGWDTFVWQNVSLAPCDAYTGTSLLNYSDLDDENAADNALYVGEGSNSGLVESDVTWKNRIYRLYAAMDSRNASFGDSSFTYEGGKEVYSQGVKELETLTLRVPADYDGLVIAIAKDITDQKSIAIDERGNILNTKDRYADILTDSSGKKHSADEFYFVKLSKLIEMFQR